MYHPYENDPMGTENQNGQNDMSQENQNQSQNQNPEQGQAPYYNANYTNQSYGSQYQNSNSSYPGYDPQNAGQQNPPPYQQPNQVMWQGDYYHTYQTPPPKKPKKERKPMGKAGKTALKITAGVLACAVISAGSIGGFAAAVNAGYVKLSGPEGTANSAFTINKLVGSDGNAVSSAAGQLTPQEVSQKVIPSVVCIQNFQNNQMQYFMGGQQGGNSSGNSASPVSEGSGIIATKDGYIITNAHVVDGADSLQVILSDGQKYEAKLIGSDSVTDLAVIKVEATDLTPAEFGSSGDLKVADTVIAIGNPGGYELSSTVTVGYVSALNRQITNSETGYTMDCIQTDAAINPGNSGGALVNLYGQVVGINSSKIAASGYEGLGFAIPIDDAQAVISDLKEHGYVKDRAVLGITGAFMDSMTARFSNLPAGMYVQSVTNESLTQAGVVPGCVIMKIDDTEVTSGSAITAYISRKKPGETVTLEGVNAQTGKEFKVQVTLSQASGQ